MTKNEKKWVMLACNRIDLYLRRDKNSKLFDEALLQGALTALLEALPYEESMALHKLLWNKPEGKELQ